MTELKEIIVTDIEEFESVDVVEILVAVGDRIEINQAVITLESDKAMMDFPSLHAGVVKIINVQVGEKVCEGDVLLALEIEDEVAKEKQVESASNTAKVNESELGLISSPIALNSIPTKVSIQDEHAYASPAIYEYARDLGVDLSKVQGSGRKSRILKQDIQSHVRTNLHQHPGGRQVKAAARSKSLDFSFYGETDSVELTKIQKLTAKNLLAAWQGIPHVTHFDQADVTLLEQHRKQLAIELSSKDIKLTPLAFVIKALVVTLKQFPQFNASLDTESEQLILKKYFHIGIAVDTPQGLLLPVLRDADKKNIAKVAAELMELGDLARQRKLTPKQMGGASMTISSLGNLGGQAFTPIINPPEVAILGLSKMIIQEDITASGVVQKKLLPLSLSYDHRVINGADAARFCTHLKGVLEDIWKLIL